MEKKAKRKAVAMFEGTEIRRFWDESKDLWFFSIVDIIASLTEQPDHKRAQSYWTTLKNRLKQEGSEVVTKCDRLKMKASDGKFYFTDAADTEAVLRLIQSIPSPKAEPFKLWLAKVGYERMQETVDPEQALMRARTNWQKLGRSEKWIGQRMLGVETRNKLTDYWADHNVKKGDEYAKLTNIIHEEWSGLTIKGHKKLKSLKSQNLRDHMSEAELIFTALAELSTRQIAESDQADGFHKNKEAAQKGGKISGNARKELEERTGKRVVSKQNYLKPNNKKRLT